MLSQWLAQNPIAHGALILLFGIVVGYLIYLLLVKIICRRSTVCSRPHESAILQHIKLPLILTVMAVCADDAIEMAGFHQYWWWDELLAVLQSLPVISITWVLVAICRSYFAQMTQHHRQEATVIHTLAMVSNIITVLLIFGGCFALLRIWSIDLNPLLASAGLVTAIGALAARDTLSDFFGGIAIFLDRPYHIGDFIVLNTGERGEVVSIGIRSTRILTRDDVFVTIPNSLMANAKIINETTFVPQYRVRCRLGVAYDSDLDEVEKVLLDSLTGNPYILQEPEPRVRYRNFGDWAIEVELLAWIKNPRDRGIARDQMIRKIHQAFRDHKIIIPYPQQEVAYKAEIKETG